MLRLLIKLYESVERPDWVNICQCLLFLDDAPEVAHILDRLLKGSEVTPRPAHYHPLSDFLLQSASPISREDPLR